MFSSKVFATALVLLLSSTAHAQSTSTMKAPAREHSVGIAIEPHWLLIGGIGGKFDVRISDNVALGLGGMYVPPRSNTSSSSDTTNDYNYRWSMYEVYFGPTINLTGDYDHSGVFITPAIGYTGSKITNFSFLNYSGSLDTAELRVTAGYQWVIRDLRFNVGAGLRLLKDSEVIVKNGAGQEVSREKSSAMGALALDLHAAWLF